MKQANSSNLFKQFKDKKVQAAYLFIAVPTILIMVFVFLPNIMGVILAFFKYDVASAPRFLGLGNFIELARDALVWHSFRVTLYYIMGTLPVAIVLGLFIALALNAKWFIGKKIVRTMYFFPVILGMVVVGFLWQWLLNPMFGFVNYILGEMGFASINFFNNVKLALPTVALIGVWKNLGFFIVVYLAGLQGIEETFYEAARIDGASKWQQIRYITWPLLAPTTFFLTVMGVIGGFQIFQLVYAITQGGPADATRVIIYDIYQNAFQFFRFGYGSAEAMILFLFIMTITLFQWRFYQKRI